MTIQKKLTSAIRGRSLVRFRYRNAFGDVANRVVAPHILYASYDGTLYLEGEDVAGGGWLRFTVAHIVQLDIADEEFSTCASFSVGRDRYAMVDAHVS